MTDAALSPLDHLDGFTVEQLSDYLDRGREPRDAAIEASSSAQNALAALSRLRAVAPRLIAHDAERFAPRNDNWITRILDQIGVQAHAGRSIPIGHDAPGARLSISEGAVRAIVREVGDRIDVLLVERVRLEGDVETAGEPVRVLVDVSTLDGADIPPTLDGFRAGVLAALELHTELEVRDVVVTLRETGLDHREGAR